MPPSVSTVWGEEVGPPPPSPTGGTPWALGPLGSWSASACGGCGSLGSRVKGTFSLQSWGGGLQEAFSPPPVLAGGSQPRPLADSCSCPHPPRPGPNRHEPGSREPPQHFGGPPPLISPKPQHHSMPTALWNPVSLMDSSLEPRRAPEGHPPHGHPAPFEPSRPAAVPLVKVERVYCPEKAEEGPRKREATPLDKYPPPPREPGALEPQAFPPGPGPFLAELEPATPTVLGQPRASLAPPAAFGEPPGPLKPGSPYRPPPPRGPDPAYVYDEFLQQRRRLVSKLDLEERRRREAQEKGLVSFPRSCARWRGTQPAAPWGSPESHRERESRPRASVAPPTCTAPQQPGGTRGPSPAPSAKCRAQPRSQKRGPRPREERVFGPGRAVPPLTCEAAGSALGPQALLFCMGLCLRADGGPECPGPPEQEGSRRAERPGLPCPRARVKDSPLPGLCQPWCPPRAPTASPERPGARGLMDAGPRVGGGQGQWGLACGWALGSEGCPMCIPWRGEPPCLSEELLSCLQDTTMTWMTPTTRATKRRSGPTSAA